MKSRFSTRSMARCAIFAAVLSILAPFSIPVGAVPITLATFAVMLAGVVLPASEAALSTAVYLLMGAVGLPVFSGAQGGLAVFAGPTGGYLWAYLLLAPITSLLSHLRCKGKPAQIALACLGGLSGMCVCYFCGTAQYMLLTQSALSPALAVCILPFIPGDVLKIALSAILGVSLRETLSRAQK